MAYNYDYLIAYLQNLDTLGSLSYFANVFDLEFAFGDWSQFGWYGWHVSGAMHQNPGHPKPEI